MRDVSDSGDNHKARAEYWDRYQDLGLERIHPIIPPGAPPASSWVAYKVAAKGLTAAQARAQWVSKNATGKLPGEWRRDGWQPRNVQKDLDRVYAPYVLGGYRWAVEHRGGGIGVSGTALLGLDIDVVVAGVAAEVLAACMALLGLPKGYPRRVGRWPKVLLPFRLAAGAAPFPKPLVFSLGDGVGAVEWLSSGQQWVMEGTHGGTGLAYAWPDGRLWELPRGLADLAEIDEDGAVGFLRRLRQRLGLEASSTGRLGKGSWPGTRANGGLGLPAPPSLVELLCSEADAAAMVAAVPNGAAVPRETYVAIAHHLHGCSGGCEWGLALFLGWAARWPSNDPEYNEALWAGLSEPHTGWRQLAGLAAKHGWAGGAELRARQAAKIFSNREET